MRQRSAIIGFAVTAGVIVLVSFTSRMALRGSILDQPAGQDASAAASVSSSLPPLADPLSDAALTRVRYVIADPSVRYALSAAGMTLDASFRDDGTWKEPGKNPLKPSYVDNIALDRDKRVTLDVDGDRRPDALVPLTVTSGPLTFSQVTVVRNLGGDKGVYAGAYPLGPGTGIQRLEPQPDGTVLVSFSYKRTAGAPAIDASMSITLRPAQRLLDTVSSSMASSETDGN